MNTFFKLCAISVIVISMTTPALAATSKKHNDSFSPQLNGAFLGIEGLNLKSENGDLDYVTVFPASSSDAFHNNAINPNYNWYWRVYGGIKFTDLDDITLSWMRLRNSESENIVGNGAVLTPRWIDVPNTYNDIIGKATFDLNDVYAVLGHTINFNNPWSVRYGFGVEYAKLDSDLKVTVQSSPGYKYVGWTSESKFNGVGPRVETDLTYHLPYNISLYGKANAALLISNRGIDLTPINVVMAKGGTTTLMGINYSDRHVVTPKFGMRLGASYDYTLGQVCVEGPSRTTTLTLDAGWQVESYIHAVERFDGIGAYSLAGVSTQGPSSSLDKTKISNFADQGLFIGLKVSSDWM